MPLAYYSSRISKAGIAAKDPSAKNILIFTFDALSASNISLFGYSRDTTPFLNQLADQATVYHNHYAAGNFTTPGTASILTGTYPWTHRAIKINGLVCEDYQSKNIFHLFEDYHTVTYSHNSLVNILQEQFFEHIDHYKPREELTLGENKWLTKVFDNDEDIASVSWLRATTKSKEDFSLSLFFSHLLTQIQRFQTVQLRKQFPIGLPRASIGGFLLEDAVDWLISGVPDLPQPFLGYFHFMPPHAPYHTRRDFVGTFNGSAHPVTKKHKHPLAKTGKSKSMYSMDESRQMYDEYILYMDAEFNRLFSSLDQGGIIDNTILILTSDHGELFERGILGHTTPSLHDPVVRSPLLIFDPAQKTRRDVYSLTSAVDILPTLLHLTDKPIPPWIEGSVLPPYADPQANRSVYSFEAKTNQPLKPLTSTSAMITKGEYKLTIYSGYKYLPQKETLIELYNIQNDPEELVDLSPDKPVLVSELQEEVTSIIESAERLYK